MTEAPLDPVYEALYRSYLEVRRQVDHLSTLREIGLAITSSLDLDETLTTIVGVVQGALDVQRVTILELSEDGRIARPIIARYGEDLIGKDRLSEESMLVAGSPMEEASARRRPVIIDTDWQSAIVVPLVANHAPLGFLRLEEPRAGLPRTREDLDLYQAVGAQVSIAINNAKLYALAVMDGLTRLYVRRYFDLRLDEEFSQARRYRRRFSLLLFDIDHFKRFNDAYGHQTGDMVLKEFARILQQSTRKTDICCRYGGEEMAIIMPESEVREAMFLAQKLCDRIRAHAFTGPNGEKLSVTTSIGVADWNAGYESPQAMLRAVDDALYRAKERGRDRVEIAQTA